MIELLYPVFQAGLGAAAYSLVWYSREVMDPSKETPEFEPFKLLATVIIGAIIGALAVLSGVEMTQELVLEQIAVYGFLVYVVEQLGKSLWRQIDKNIEALE